MRLLFLFLSFNSRFFLAIVPRHLSSTTQCSTSIIVPSNTRTGRNFAVIFWFFLFFFLVSSKQRRQAVIWATARRGEILQPLPAFLPIGGQLVFITIIHSIVISFQWIFFDRLHVSKVRWQYLALIKVLLQVFLRLLLLLAGFKINRILVV